MDVRGPQFVSVAIFDIKPWVDRQAIEDFVKTVPEILQVRHLAVRHPPRFHLLLDFDPKTDIYKALRVSYPNQAVTIDHQELPFYISPHLPDEESYMVVSRVCSDPPTSLTPEAGTPQPYLKLNGMRDGHGDCHICRSEIDGPFSTPCFDCQMAVCHDCIGQHFALTLVNFQFFPARCCEAIFHPDVAKGILSEDEHIKYKARFEERVTKDPLYCPVPTCSVLIPPRLYGNMEKFVINCHACQSPICLSCRLLAHPDQKCTGRKEMDFSPLKGSKYKPCPRCGMPLIKIDGCSHVQCKCGVHMCWGCGRKLATCLHDPCHAQDDMIDDESDAEEPDQQPDTEGMIDTSGLNIDDETPAETNALPATNLNDPIAAAWDPNDFDEDLEPGDRFDVLSCKHSFIPLLANQIPRHWMTASIPDWWDRDVNDRHIECMKCRSTTKPMKAGDEGEKKAQGRDRMVARRCKKCYLIVCGECK